MAFPENLPEPNKNIEQSIAGFGAESSANFQKRESASESLEDRVNSMVKQADDLFRPPSSETPPARDLKEAIKAVVADLDVAEKEIRRAEKGGMEAAKADALRKKVLDTKDMLEKLPKAVTTAQALWRGKQARDRTILIKEVRGALEPLLEKEIPSKRDRESLYTAIAQELKASIDSPELHGKDVRFERSKGTYHRLSLRKSSDKTAYETKETTNPWTFWIKADPKTKEASVELDIPIEREADKLGEGTYKTVYSGYRLAVPLKREPDGKRLMPNFREAVAVPKQPRYVDSTLKPAMLRHQDLYERIGKGNDEIRITEPPRLREHGSVREMPQKPYPSDMGKVANKPRVKLGPNDVVEVLPIDSFNMALDVFNTLVAFSEEGICHRDVKPPNALVGMDEKAGRLAGYLHDFDLVADYGPTIGAAYCYWDSCSQNGLVTHACDVVGGLLTTIESLLLPHLSTVGNLYSADHQIFLEPRAKRRLLNRAVRPKLYDQARAFNLPDSLLEKLRDSRDFENFQQILTNALAKDSKLSSADRKNIEVLQAWASAYEDTVQLTLDTLRKQRGLQVNLALSSSLDLLERRASLQASQAVDRLKANPKELPKQLDMCTFQDFAETLQGLQTKEGKPLLDHLCEDVLFRDKTPASWMENGSTELLDRMLDYFDRQLVRDSSEKNPLGAENMERLKRAVDLLDLQRRQNGLVLQGLGRANSSVNNCLAKAPPSAELIRSVCSENKADRINSLALLAPYFPTPAEVRDRLTAIHSKLTRELDQRPH